jgi:MOSC domain-containing protein YiiM
VPASGEGIYISPEAQRLPNSVETAVAQAGVGLEGDRYAVGAGTFSDTPGTGRALTLVEAEALDGLDPPLEHAEARRNVVTRGVRLNDLVGKRFFVGEVECEGMRLCEPCADLEREVGRPGLLRELVHQGGLRADILAGGEIRVGDAVSRSAGSA